MNFKIEELSMNAWPSLQTILLDGWIIRMANGYTKRANSINPIYSFDKNLDEKIIYCEKLYKMNNLPVIYKIVDCEEQRIIDNRLEELNYDKIDFVSVQVCNEINHDDVKIDQTITEENFSESWKNCFYDCYDIKDVKTIETIENMLVNIRHKKIFVHKKIKGTFIGCGYGVIEDGFVGLFDIVVKDEFRGNGYGKEIVEAILIKAHEIGIMKAHLHVSVENSVAKNLYKKLGFEEIYKTWFRIKL